MKTSLQILEELTDELTLRDQALVAQYKILKDFFESSIDLLCVANLEGKFEMVNNSFCEQLGWSKEELLKEKFMLLIHPNDVQRTEEEIEKLKTGYYQTLQFINRYRCSDGTYKTLVWNARTNKQGKVFAIARVSTQAQCDTCRCYDNLKDPTFPCKCCPYQKRNLSAS
jgi:PAS domain S-box-containing protein